MEILIIATIAFILTKISFEALKNISWTQIRKTESKNKKTAAKLEKYLESRDKLYLSFRFTIASLFAIIVFEIIKLGIFKHEYTFLIIILALIYITELLSIFSIFIGLSILRILYPIFNLLSIIFYPLTIISEKITQNAINRDSLNDEDEKITAEDEILSLVDQEEGDEKSELEEDEIRMIKGIFDLDDTMSKEIMTPRVDIKGVDIKTPLSEVKNLFISTGFSRIPVFKDRIDEIKGIVFAKDFLDDEKLTNSILNDFVHKPIFIPETKFIDELLEEFQKQGNHIAVIIDEYGGTAGIITLEDIIEEIIGEIKDEYDDDNELNELITKVSDIEYVIDARMLIDDVNEELEIDIPVEDVDTIGGYICSLVGKIPEVGEVIETEIGIEFNILKADAKKIITLKIIKDID